MSYINTNTLESVSAQQIMRLHPNVSFPNTSWDNDILAPFGYAVLTEPDTHPIPEKYQKLVEDTPINDNGRWTKQYKVASVFEQYTDDSGKVVTVQEQEQKAEADEQENKKQLNKQKASAELVATEWVENPSVSDSTKPVYLSNFNEIMDYRMALRLIAIDPPAEVEMWPMKPNNIWVNNK